MNTIVAALWFGAIAMQTPARVDPQPAIEITSPREMQVFQRGDDGEGRVLIQGWVTQIDLDTVPDFGVVVELANGATTPWKKLEPAREKEGGRPFHALLHVPQGGWHSMRIGSQDGAKTLASVKRFGVGEVFLVAGQSNSTNFGEERTVSQDDRVVAFDGWQWTLAADPMPGVQDGSQGGSPWPSFGHLLRASLGVPVAIASVGYGGTSIRQWQPDDESAKVGHPTLYDGLRQRSRCLGRVRAIVWHQGESDALSGMSSAEYEHLFRTLVTGFRKHTGVDAPWIVAHASFVPDLAADKMTPIRAAQAELWRSGFALQGPDTDDLQGDMRHSKDHIHFSKAGLEVHAQRWYAMVWSQLFAEPKLRSSER